MYKLILTIAMAAMFTGCSSVKDSFPDNENNHCREKGNFSEGGTLYYSNGSSAYCQRKIPGAKLQVAYKCGLHFDGFCK